MPSKYLEYYKKEFNTIDEKYIKEYFVNSKFKDELLLYVCLTDDKFNSSNINYCINFSGKEIIFKKISEFKKTF